MMTGLVVGVTGLLALVLVAFAWPAANLAPRDLPIAVAGAPQSTAPIAEQLAADGAFDVRRVDSRADAVAAIEDREVYAAIVPGPDGVELLTASAASPVVAQLLTQVATTATSAQGSPPPQNTDVVALPEDDPRGAAFSAGALPLVIGGIATGVVVSLRLAGRRQRLAAVAGIAALSGLAMAGVLQGWLGALSGSYWANSAVMALGIAATGSMIVGLHNLLGPAGIGLGAGVTLLLGNPLSGITSAPELLPAGWGELGQWLVPGAAGTALRSTAFFDGAGAGVAVATLIGWVALGVALALMAPRRRTTSEHPAGRELAST
jgi:hypothetical protein